MLGGYRRVTVFLYLTFVNFYDGPVEFTRFVMVLEVFFLVLFSIYVCFLLWVFFKERLARMSYSRRFFWYLFVVYLIFFVMGEELYS